jgi:integrase
MNLYIQYLIEDLDRLCVEALPDYVFVNLWGGNIGQPLTYAAVRSFCKKLRRQACQKLGLAPDFPLTPHMFRHTRATEWIRDDKLPLSTVSRLLGHASIKTTHDTYVHLTDEDTREALELARKRQRGE